MIDDLKRGRHYEEKGGGLRCVESVGVIMYLPNDGRELMMMITIM